MQGGTGPTSATPPVLATAVLSPGALGWGRGEAGSSESEEGRVGECAHEGLPSPGPGVVPPDGRAVCRGSGRQKPQWPEPGTLPPVASRFLRRVGRSGGGGAASSGLTRILPGIPRWGPVPAGARRAGRGTAPAWHRVARPAWARTALWPAELLSDWSWAGEPAGGREQGRGPQRGPVGKGRWAPLWAGTWGAQSRPTLQPCVSQEGWAQVQQGNRGWLGARGFGLWLLFYTRKRRPRGSPTPSPPLSLGVPLLPLGVSESGRGCKEMAQQSGRR